MGLRSARGLHPPSPHLCREARLHHLLHCPVDARLPPLIAALDLKRASHFPYLSHGRLAQVLLSHRPRLPASIYPKKTSRGQSCFNSLHSLHCQRLVIVRDASRLPPAQHYTAFVDG